MSQKSKLVVFTRTNARILVNPTNREIQTYKNAVINPDLSAVKAVPPHFWKQEKGKVVPMSDYEMKARLDDISKYGIDNEIKRLSAWKSNPSVPFYIMRQLSNVMFFTGSAMFLYIVLYKFYPDLIASIQNYFWSVN